MIADEFGYESFRHYVTNADNTPYINNNFEVSAFLTRSFNNSNRSPAARMLNSLTTAMKEKSELPKIIVFILEDNLLESHFLRLPNTDGRISETYNRFLKWFITNIERAIEAFKDLLPNKAVRKNIPRVLMLSPAVNSSFKNNIKRKKFGKCLNNVTRMHHNMSCLQLRQGWDEQDRKLYLNELNRWSHEGLTKFYNAVDRCISFCDSCINKKPQFKKNPGFQRETDGNSTRPRYPSSTPARRNNAEVDEDIDSYNTIAQDDLRWQLSSTQQRRRQFSNKLFTA